MSYATGTASTLADIRQAIINACTAAGWTNDGNVVYKDGCYARIQVVGSTIELLGGTGQSGGTLSGAGASLCKVISVGAAVLASPYTYHIFVNASPDEVYCVIQYSSLYFQWLAFGRSSMTLPSPGTGVWYGATSGPAATVDWIVNSSSLGGNNASNVTSGGLFCTNRGSTAISNTNTFIHHGLDAVGWSALGGTDAVGGIAQAIGNVQPLLGILPNAWNGEAVLLPIHVTVGRASSRYSLVAQIRHARYTRVDNYVAAQVITLGADQWMIFPWFKKDTTQRDATTTQVLHSGTFGWAIRYTP